MPLSPEKRREWDQRRSRETHSALQDIGPPPAVVDQARRDACKYDLGLFQKTYMEQVFFLPPADFHRRATEKMQKAVLEGGQFAWAQPRGSGKTSQAESCVLWAMLYGHRSFPLFVGASEQAATQRIDAVKVRLETSQLLFEDFPEVCHPIRELNRTPRRAPTQKIGDEPTFIKWKADEVVFAHVEGSEVGGACLRVAGITSSIRGMSSTTRDGEVIRPDLVIVDDPQSRESAKSATQTDDRLAIIAADLAYLTGPGIPIAMLIPCTVIYQHDLADQLLDRQKYPQFRGERTKMVVSMPKNMELWSEYHEIFKDSLRNDGDHTPATEFYKVRRAEMDEGAVVSWPERKAPHQLSPIQHAMDLFLADPSAFASEMQNEPIERQEEGEGACKPAEIMEKRSHLARHEVPTDATTIVAAVDVQKTCLYYAVMAFADTYTASVLDYGVWPPQKRRSFSLADIKTTLQSFHDASGVEAAIYAGLVSLVASLEEKPMTSEGTKFLADETRLHDVDMILIDAAWGDSTGVVKEVCRRLGAKCMPSFGKGIKATSQPMHQWAKQKGERIGPHWRIRRDRESNQKYVVFDSNWWKSFVHARFKTVFGERGCYSLFGKAHNRRTIDGTFHKDFGRQTCAEFPRLVESGGNRCNEWFLRQMVKDNHFLDCVVMCSVAASLSGVSMAGAKQRAARKAVESSMEQFFGRQ